LLPSSLLPSSTGSAADDCEFWSSSMAGYKFWPPPVHSKTTLAIRYFSPVPSWARFAFRHQRLNAWCRWGCRELQGLGSGPDSGNHLSWCSGQSDLLVVPTAAAATSQ
jgi:hypothetical protein